MTTDTGRRGRQMRAAVYRRFGGPDLVRVEAVPRPPVSRSDVLIRVRASTVSAADHRTRSRDVPRGLGLLAAFGIGALRPKHPVLGMDVAGVVEAVGPDVTGYRPGDEVIAMLGARFGGHAEYAVVRQDDPIALKPPTMTFEDAVTLVFGGLTARGFLQQADVAPGASVLVNGASGAVIVDCVGNAPFDRVKHVLKPGGALLLAVADLQGLLQAPLLSRRTGIVVTVSAGKPTANDLAYLVALAGAGELRAVRDRTYDLTEIAEAHRYVDTGRKRGNVVVRISSSQHQPTVHRGEERAVVMTQAAGTRKIRTLTGWLMVVTFATSIPACFAHSPVATESSYRPPSPKEVRHVSRITLTGIV